MRKRADRSAWRCAIIVWRRRCRPRHEIECHVITLYSKRTTYVWHIARLWITFGRHDYSLHFQLKHQAILWINIISNKSLYVSVRFSVSCSREPRAIYSIILRAHLTHALDMRTGCVVQDSEQKEFGYSAEHFCLTIRNIFFFLWSQPSQGKRTERNYRASYISSTFSKSVLRNKKKLIGILFKFTGIELYALFGRQAASAAESLVNRCTR